MFNVAFRVEDLEGMRDFVKQNLYSYIKEALTYSTSMVLTLEGDLGAGKTTITSYLIDALTDGEIKNATSPTFGILNKYKAKDGLVVNHYDLYRIKDESELEEIGFYETLFEGLTIIEWPLVAKKYIQKHENFDDSKFLGIKISILNPETKVRELRFF